MEQLQVLSKVRDYLYQGDLLNAARRLSSRWVKSEDGDVVVDYFNSHLDAFVAANPEFMDMQGLLDQGEVLAFCELAVEESFRILPLSQSTVVLRSLLARHFNRCAEKDGLLPFSGKLTLWSHEVEERMLLGGALSEAPATSLYANRTFWSYTRGLLSDEERERALTRWSAWNGSFMKFVSPTFFLFFVWLNWRCHAEGQSMILRQVIQSNLSINLSDVRRANLHLPRMMKTLREKIHDWFLEGFEQLAWLSQRDTLRSPQPWRGQPIVFTSKARELLDYAHRCRSRLNVRRQSTNLGELRVWNCELDLVEQVLQRNWKTSLWYTSGEERPFIPNYEDRAMPDGLSTYVHGPHGPSPSLINRAWFYYLHMMVKHGYAYLYKIMKENKVVIREEESAA